LIAAVVTLVPADIKAVPDHLDRFIDRDIIGRQLVFIELEVELLWIELLPKATAAFYPNELYSA